MNNTFTYKCVNCGNKYSANEIIYLCPECSKENSDKAPPKGVLKTIYNYSELQNSGINFEHLKKTRFADLLPVNDLNNLPNLKIGNTPVYKISKLNNKNLPFELFLKDDSQNPTFSFKDRASGLVSAFAKENGINTIITASTGNAGSSLAGICAAQSQKAIILVPAGAPIAKLTQIVMYGASIIPVKGTYDDAFDLSIKATEEFGWYNRNTGYNPLTIEGKKTVSFEIFDQLNQNLPDRIFVPVGDGVIISGVYKGFEDLSKLNIINKIPTIVAVQAEGSDNLVRNLKEDSFVIRQSSTIADSISVDIPRNYYMTKDFIEKYKGEYLSVSDNEIISASVSLSKNTGLFAEPAAATAFAGLIKYLDTKKIEDGSKNVVLLTGSGLKDVQVLKSQINIPTAIEPDVENLILEINRIK